MGRENCIDYYSIDYWSKQELFEPLIGTSYVSSFMAYAMWELVTAQSSYLVRNNALPICFLKFVNNEKLLHLFSTD